MFKMCVPSVKFVFLSHQFYFGYSNYDNPIYKFKKSG